MIYTPNLLDAIDVYVTAAADHYHVPPNAIDHLSQADVQQTSLGAFRILPRERNDASGKTLENIAICIYDRSTRLWLVRLQGGAIAKVRDTGDGFVVVAD